MSKTLAVDQLQEAVDTFQATGSNYAKAALLLGIPRPTVQSRIEQARRRGITPRTADPNDPLQLKSQIKRLQSDLRDAQQERVNHAMIKHKIIGLTREVADVTPPAWMCKESKKRDAPGVPTVFLSDLHWAEIVDPKQINGVNEYNLDIANRRLRQLAEKTIRLCNIISPSFHYPGIVVALGGDLYSGNIHEELTATNEVNSMPAVLDLFGALCSFVDAMLLKFEYVFIPCVAGNHGRMTRKPWAKDRHATSFDWLTYCFLAKRFEQNKRVTFLIPDGPDAYYKIYNHRYILNHGDSFRAGDSTIGPFGPVMRGSLKKASRNSQINMEFDTMIIGHFHTELFTRRVIMNGSLVGYNEFAFRENFAFEPPAQQLWITHPVHGLTYRMPVQVEESRAIETARQWLSVAT